MRNPCKPEDNGVVTSLKFWKKNKTVYKKKYIGWERGIGTLLQGPYTACKAVYYLEVDSH